MGATKGNLNGLRHGGYSNRRIDLRSSLGQAIKRLRHDFEENYGGKDSLPAPKRELLEQTIHLKLVLDSMWSYAMRRKSIFRRGGELIPCLMKNYLAYSAQFTRNLVVLGLERQTKAIPSLRDYLEARATQAPPNGTEPNPYQDQGEETLIDGQGSQGAAGGDSAASQTEPEEGQGDEG
jgi:hypothetical protein